MTETSCGYCGAEDLKDVHCSECGRSGYLEGFYPWEHFDDKKKEKMKMKSGGRWWVIADGGIHGRSIIPAWWTGAEFTGVNNKIVTYVSPMSLPPMLKGNYFKPDGTLVNEDGSRSIFDDLAD